MGALFRVLAKLVGIFWTAYSLAMILSTGFILMAPGPRPESLANELVFRFLVFLGLLVQLTLAVSLMIGTDRWASFLRVPSDSHTVTFGGEDVLKLGTQLVGIYFLVQSAPNFIAEGLAILHPAAAPVNSVSDVLPLVRPGATFLLGCLCAFGTTSITRLVAANEAPNGKDCDRQGDRR